MSEGTPKAILNYGRPGPKKHPIAGVALALLCGIFGGVGALLVLLGCTGLLVVIPDGHSRAHVFGDVVFAGLILVIGLAAAGLAGLFGRLAYTVFKGRA
jgi:hypothetical protein